MSKISVIGKISMVFVFVALAQFFVFSGRCDASDMAAKIGVIDVRKVLQESRALKEAENAYILELEARQAKKQEIRRLEEELKKSDQTLTEKERKEKNDRLFREVNELQRLTADTEEELKKRNTKRMLQLIDDILQVVKKFQKREGYTVILNKSDVVVFDDAVDVTAQILTLYNASSSLHAARPASPDASSASASKETSARQNSGIAGYIKAQSVNLRQKPTTESPIVGRYPLHMALTIVGQSGDWYQVIIENQSGYIKRDFVGKGTPSR